MQGVGDGVGWHGRTQTCISLRLAYKIPAEPLRGTGWGCAPHTGGHSFMKRVTRKGRHVRFGQIPFKAAFSWRRAQSPAVIVTGQFTPSWLLHGAPFMPPRKRAQGFDVALYRRGAGRLLAAEVDFAASRTSSWHAPTAKKTTSYQWFSCRAAVTATTTSLPCARGDVGKRVPCGHNAEGVSDPQSSTEASADHG